MKLDIFLECTVPVVVDSSMAKQLAVLSTGE